MADTATSRDPSAEPSARPEPRSKGMWIFVVLVVATLVASAVLTVAYLGDGDELDDAPTQTPAPAETGLAD